jgi:hypothetical protein
VLTANKTGTLLSKAFAKFRAFFRIKTGVRWEDRDEAADGGGEKGAGAAAVEKAGGGGGGGGGGDEMAAKGGGKGPAMDEVETGDRKFKYVPAGRSA